ncbi:MULTISPECIES: cell division protein FtsZ [Bacteroides]|uniref:Cell division protein FtsZ n=2 Tax=Bacteroidaceae TaxID=815 RepID=A0ABT7VFD3_9BACE|nr:MULTISPECIES: cell division protein FtsZ [Bacteroides]MBU3855551.1 cell division protein FtsZ [Candidatus Phocaeicola excrementipullorum]MBW9199637.1 cell division protein FtsZ [Bacteroidales bacterium SW299]MCR8917166.1 cell division protein FtsZ [Bacteroides sp. ET225]MDM8207888.1 cell division protein FtsZ [Bacteroides gallinaceum]MDM8325012.1 cell division protein FtsZ [Bacteroides gallinaceum]
MPEEKRVPFDFEKDFLHIIKVIGVGGGGGNAVNHMYKEGIHDVTFVVCNTDKQILNESPVLHKLQLGSEGLGAGNKPDRGRAAAEESMDDIKEMLSDGCRMAFITAGMGGGTGTGAAPVIAKTAKDMGILTVGIVTIPFLFEGYRKIDQALDGVEEMSKNVDALLVINNERLRHVYSDLSVKNAFGKADDTLSVAAKSIAEIITLKGEINLDFNDVQTVLKDGGVAIMSTGYGEGENRVSQAITDALNSPLLNNNDIFNSKKVLFVITYNPSSELMMGEMDEIHEFMSRFERYVETKWGLYTDEKLGDKIKFTILATGFGIKDVPGMEAVAQKHSAEEQRRLAEQQQREDSNTTRRANVYKGMLENDRRKKDLKIYIFSQEDLDNDDIISVVETTPTYNRTKKALDSIKSKANIEEMPPAESGSSEDSSDPQKIFF